MLKKLTIKCYGNPKPSNSIQFMMDDHKVTTLKFDNVETSEKDGLYTLTYNTNAPLAFKPWHIMELVTSIPGVTSYFNISFNTERFFVVFTNETIERLNNELQTEVE